MTTTAKNTLRRFLSLSAFTALIAAFSMAFAQAPTAQRHLDFDQAKPALTPLASTAPSHTRTAKSATTRATSAKKAPASQKSSTNTLSGTLNLNTASESELTKLPGIGPKKAERIVSWRTKHGKFRRVVDLRRVKGFGAKSVKKLKPYLSVTGANTLE